MLACAGGGLDADGCRQKRGAALRSWCAANAMSSNAFLSPHGDESLPTMTSEDSLQEERERESKLRSLKEALRETMIRGIIDENQVIFHPRSKHFAPPSLALCDPLFTLSDLHYSTELRFGNCTVASILTPAC